MNKALSKINIFLLLCLLVILALFINEVLFNVETSKNEEAEACPINKVVKTIQGDSMSPLLTNGQEVYLLEDYYQCGNQPQFGELVAYYYAGSEQPVIKIIKATDQDQLEIIEQKLMINGQFLVNSAGQEYVFTPAEIKMLVMYIIDGHLPIDSYLIFGDNINISTDSRKFGAVSKDDFFG